MSTTFRTEEDTTGFLVYVDGVILERDVAQQEAAEIRSELVIARSAHADRIAEHKLRADSLRAELARQVDEHEAEIAELDDVIAATRNQRDDWAGIATGRAEEINDLHTVIAGLRRQLGIRP